MERIALIPAYTPDEKLVAVAKELNENGFRVIIVNDGSPSDCDAIFDKTTPYAATIRHEQNKGKGEALKTGMRYITAHFEKPYIVVNADADGQHRTKDILRITEIAEKNPDDIILGSRKFDGKIPLRSRFGNSMTRIVFRLSSGTSVYDTQTGLRAYSDALIDRLIAIDGSRYEYEMNMLMTLAKEGCTIREEWIETVYLDNNATSHFHPLIDSVKIYKEILKFSASSLLSFLVDYALFCLFSALSGNIVLSNISARVLSGTLNFTLNRKMVFRTDVSILRSALKYIALAVFLLVFNTLLLSLLTSIGVSAYIAKIFVEVVMFTVSYIIQRCFIFKKK